MLPDAFKEFIELLEKHEIRYLIVGGYAVAAHGYPRYTGDIDLDSSGNLVSMTIEHAKSQARIKEFSFEEIDDQENIAV